LSGLRVALGFLTAIPMRGAPAQGGLGRAAVWFPFVGLALGALAAAGAWLLALAFPPPLAAGLAVALWAGLTGGLHLDGLADCCDGLLAAAAPARRLEIMRDPHVGAFGAVGLILFLLLKVLAVSHLLSTASTTNYVLRFAFYEFRITHYAFLLAPTLARWLILIVARQPRARPGGLGAGFAEGLKPATILLAAVLPAALMALGGWRGLAAAGAGGAAAAGVAALARARLGGVTGDVLGLTVEMVELAALLALGAFVA
jgi:adenosylcobinamide-GDP ribazoletransferase